MTIRTILTLAMLGLVAAEHSVVSLFMFDTDPQPMIGSIVAANAGTTTYSINCPAGVDAEHCGLLPGLIYTTAPSTVEWHFSASPYNRYGTVSCSMGGTTTAVCTGPAPISGHAGPIPGQTTTITGPEFSSLPVTITAGPSAAATAPNAGVETTSTGGSGGGNSEGSGAGTTASQTSASAASTSSSTGGMPRMTAGPGVVLGGAAAVLAAAAAL